MRASPRCSARSRAPRSTRSPPSFLRSLPPQQRLTLLLVYGERFDYIDAGRVLDVPSETIGARLVRISASLADRLSADEPAPASATVATLYPRDRTVMTELSDELLVAYVDGQLARKQTGAIEKVLEQDDVIAKRVDALKDAHSRLEAAFEAILAGEEADAEASPVPQGPGLFIPRDTLAKAGLAAAGIAAALVLICRWLWLAAGHARFRPPLIRHREPGLCRQPPAQLAGRSRAHTSAAQPRQSRSRPRQPGQSRPHRPSSSRKPSARASMCRTSRRTDSISSARSSCSSATRRLAQILYLGASGAPLALYARKGEGTFPPSFKRYGDIGGVAWSQGGVAYLLAGEQPETSLLALAEAIRTAPELDATGPVSTANRDRKRAHCAMRAEGV